MYTSVIIFKGSADDSNTYQLAYDNGTIYIIRNFAGDTGHSDQIGSGWHYEQVINKPALCIDFGQKWFVYPTAEAWEDIDCYIYASSDEDPLNLFSI